MRIRILLLLIIALSILFSCSKNNTTDTPDTSSTFKITSITPTSASIGDIVSISGINFGDIQNTSYVSFNNTQATIYTSWNDTQIKAKVPTGASSGKVYITVNGVKSNEVDFTVDPVKTFQVTSITPTSARIGDVVTIYGSGFGASQTISSVSFNGTKATEYSSWSDTDIKVKVPTGATSGKVYVTVNGVKSNEVEFIITPPETAEMVTIGTQVWMLKNLNVDHYRNGDSIPEVKDATAWANLTTGAWCYYNNDPANGKIYGKLYNWYAVNDPRGLAPIGWLVPSDAECTALTTFLGGRSVAGGKMKETGTSHWRSPNTGATNSSNFSALPGGCRDYGGITFSDIGGYGVWWSSTELDATYAWAQSLDCDHAVVGRYGSSKGYGFSVRCVKD